MGLLGSIARCQIGISDYPLMHRAAGPTIGSIELINILKVVHSVQRLRDGHGLQGEQINRCLDRKWCAWSRDRFQQSNLQGVRPLS